jgi:hypothetical protein
MLSFNLNADSSGETRQLVNEHIDKCICSLYPLIRISCYGHAGDDTMLLRNTLDSLSHNFIKALSLIAKACNPLIKTKSYEYKIKQFFENLSQQTKDHIISILYTPYHYAVKLDRKSVV